MEGQIHMFDLTVPEISIARPIRLIELFAGIGSQAMALRDLGAGFEHHRVVESDKSAIASYNAIHGTDFTAVDIRDLKGADLGIAEKESYCYILTYSFPCQDLSLAGKMRGMKKGSGTRSGLLWEVERLLDETDQLPDVLLMENVPQVMGKKNIGDFDAWRGWLSAKGYTNYTQILNAREYGIPQNRKRCFMLSILGAYNYHFPSQVPLAGCIDDHCEDDVDETYYIDTEGARKIIEEYMDGEDR